MRCFGAHCVPGLLVAFFRELGWPLVMHRGPIYLGYSPQTVSTETLVALSQHSCSLGNKLSCLSLLLTPLSSPSTLVHSLPDQGCGWRYRVSAWPPLTGGQRAVCVRSTLGRRVRRPWLGKSASMAFMAFPGLLGLLLRARKPIYISCPGQLSTQLLASGTETTCRGQGVHSQGA